jgi:hypothetical protein
MGDGRMQVAVAKKADLRGGVEPNAHGPCGNRAPYHGGEGGRQALPARVLDGQQTFGVVIGTADSVAEALRPVLGPEQTLLVVAHVLHEVPLREHLEGQAVKEEAPLH